MKTQTCRDKASLRAGSDMTHSFRTLRDRQLSRNMLRVLMVRGDSRQEEVGDTSREMEILEMQYPNRKEEWQQRAHN